MFTEFDVLASVITLVFTIAFLTFGVVRSCLFFVAYAGAGFITLFFQPWMADLLSSSLGEGLLANIVAILLLFLLALIILFVINAILLDFVRDHRGGAIDRSLGMLMGLLLGFFTASALHLAITEVRDGDEPEWITAGQTYTLTHWGSDILNRWFWEDNRENAEEVIENMEDAVVEVETMIDDMAEDAYMDVVE